ncbi:MAG: dUTP diphosphatase [Ignavibacteriota bacterium]|nr:dUTP diphosphatase [Ignavibacteriota bacterium]
MNIKINKFNKDLDCVVPKYATEDSAGMDLSSASAETIVLHPGEYKLIPTNLIFEIPKRYEGQIRPRSGLALKFGITVLNSPGTVDADYRGEVKVLLINHSDKDFGIKYGDRIAQMIIAKYEKAILQFDDNISDTERGTGGYGSTGQ